MLHSCKDNLKDYDNILSYIKDKVTRLITFKIFKPIIAFNRWVVQFPCEFKEYFIKLPINSRVIIFNEIAMTF